MTPAPAAQESPRGAGSGEHAVATRDRQPDQKASEYAKGDAAKGKIDPKDPDRYIPMRDRRAFLVDQAEKNEAANDELNAIQSEQNTKFMKVMKELDPVIDPDRMREESMETAVAALKMHDPEEMKKRAETAQKTNEKNAKAVNQNSADHKAGQASG